MTKGILIGVTLAVVAVCIYHGGDAGIIVGIVGLVCVVFLQRL